MRQCSFFSAFQGGRLWRKKIIPLGMSGVLVIPDYDSNLLESMASVFPEYVELSNQNGATINVFYNDHRIKEYLFEKYFFHFHYIEKTEMDNLVSFMRFTMKQYGAIRQQNVKLISIDECYAGQLNVLERSKAYALECIILDDLLMME